MDETQCVICEADFRSSSLVTSVGGLKKCKPCEALYPKAFSKKEVQVKTKDKARSMDEARVQEMIYDTLEAANIIRHRCDKCGEMFFRHKPMQKVCHKCEKKTDGEGK